MTTNVFKLIATFFLSFVFLHGLLQNKRKVCIRQSSVVMKTKKQFKHFSKFFYIYILFKVGKFFEKHVRFTKRYHFLFCFQSTFPHSRTFLYFSTFHICSFSLIPHLDGRAWESLKGINIEDDGRNFIRFHCYRHTVHDSGGCRSMHWLKGNSTRFLSALQMCSSISNVDHINYDDVWQ